MPLFIIKWRSDAGFREDRIQAKTRADAFDCWSMAHDSGHIIDMREA